MKFPTGFTDRNLRGFARFPGDSAALVFLAKKEITVNRATGKSN